METKWLMFHKERFASYAFCWMHFIVFFNSFKPWFLCPPAVISSHNLQDETASRLMKAVIIYKMRQPQDSWKKQKATKFTQKNLSEQEKFKRNGSSSGALAKYLKQRAQNTGKESFYNTKGGFPVSITSMKLSVALLFFCFGTAEEDCCQ